MDGVTKSNQKNAVNILSVQQSVRKTEAGMSL